MNRSLRVVHDVRKLARDQVGLANTLQEGRLRLQLDAVHLMRIEYANGKAELAPKNPDGLSEVGVVADENCDVQILWARRPESDPFAARKVIHLRV